VDGSQPRQRLVPAVEKSGAASRAIGDGEDATRDEPGAHHVQQGLSVVVFGLARDEDLRGRVVVEEQGGCHLGKGHRDRFETVGEHCQGPAGFRSKVRTVKVGGESYQVLDGDRVAAGLGPVLVLINLVIHWLST
jgi:hypothetical protein